jgi:hypothetical protein
VQIAPFGLAGEAAARRGFGVKFNITGSNTVAKLETETTMRIGARFGSLLALADSLDGYGLRQHAAVVGDYLAAQKDRAGCSQFRKRHA